MSLQGAVKRALHAGGHYRRHLRTRAFPGVAVLCYHGVRADDLPGGSLPFEALHVRAGELAAHCAVIRDTCHPIDLERWRAALAGGPPLPARPVLLTFDDGYRSCLAAAEILARHRVPGLFFACSGAIESRTAFWFDAVARARGEAEVERLKTVPYASWQETVAAFAASGEEGPGAVLDPAGLCELARRPGCTIGGHTSSHPLLARAGRNDQRAEIAGDRRRLGEWLDGPPAAFAYPNGRPGLDYTPETVELVGEAGYEFAFTTRGGFAHAGEPPLERSRFLMLAGVSGAELAHRLSYSWHR